MGKKGYLINFDHSMVFISTSKSADPLGISHTTISRVFRDCRKATVILIHECTCQTVNQMGYSSRKPHEVPLLLAKETEATNPRSSPKLEKKRKKWKNISPDLIRLTFCCHIHMLGSEFV